MAWAIVSWAIPVRGATLPTVVEPLHTLAHKYPDNFKIQYQLNKAYREHGLFSEAVAKYEKAIAQNPDDSRAHYFLALVYQDLGQTQQAIQQLKTSIRLRPFSEAYNSLGGLYSEMGLQEDAIREYQNAIRLKPDFGWPHINLGSVYYYQQRYTLAAEAFQTAISQGEYAPAYYHLGRVYEKLNEYEKALECLQHAVQLYPGYINAYKAMAEVYRALDQPQKQKEAWVKYYIYSFLSEEKARLGLSLLLVAPIFYIPFWCCLLLIGLIVERVRAQRALAFQ